MLIIFDHSISIFLSFLWDLFFIILVVNELIFKFTKEKFIYYVLMTTIFLNDFNKL